MANRINAESPKKKLEPPKKAGVVSLGCSKNRVDTELMLGYLERAGYEITPDPKEAEVLIVNTCGFIEPAKQESIDAILDMARYKPEGRCKALVVTGCLSERYRSELPKELPEVDIWLGVREYEKLVPALASHFGEAASAGSALYPWGERRLTTPSYRALLRVADGCDNLCAYCAIPLIRGPYKSRDIEDIVSEAEALVARGAVELEIIAQDTTRFGTDTVKKRLLPELLRRLSETDAKWLRILYAYPDEMDDELLDAIDSIPKVVRYLDIPLQHADDNVLKMMNRRGSSGQYAKLIDGLRQRDPSYILRTTYMVGFPGETEQAFETLCEFVKAHPFDRMGAFAFSPEEGTLAAGLPNQVPKEEKQRRLDKLMSIQREVSNRLARRRIGAELDVLIEGYDGKAKRYFGRSYGEAADIDGLVFFAGAGEKKPGEFAKVRIDRVTDYDLYGEEIK